MAQAARLNLRMQKELKLLMSDPPPGVSLPFLSGNDEYLSFSLTSIEARIGGPAGTVYEKGIFNLKIQIPERYPFQPPNVTFITPIYHPNIDNGGRICLDILNLPPKGAWQPSLNISTVLTSIGLLLSEPNPDDGLMAETSREYKYNRQAFEQKARSWTEKYAYVGASGRSEDCSISTNQNMVEVDRAGASSVNAMGEKEVSRKKLRLIGEKLPLKSTPIVKTSIDNKENVAPTRCLSLPCFQNPHPVSASALLSNNAVNCGSKSLHDNAEEVSNRNHKQQGSLKVVETIIVSDSEESEDEDSRSSRSRFCIMRKPMLGKRN